jgi:hypothetical protein
MPLSRLISRRWAILLWLVLLVAALVIWSVRPWILSTLLELDEFQEDGRLAVLEGWAAGRIAPMTPTGFLTLFPMWDMLLAGLLLGAIVVLSSILLRRSTGGERGPWLTEPIGELRFRRFRFRYWTIIGLIVILGLECAWESVEWRKWHLRERYLGLADGYASSADRSRIMLRRVQAELIRLDAENAVAYADSSIPVDVTRKRDYMETHFLYRFALVTAFDQLVHKYAAAAKQSLQPIPPDPPLPHEPGKSVLTVGVYSRDYGRILGAYDELVRSYPQDARAHEGRAWLLATCPDQKYRDGTNAVLSASQACKLTNWQKVTALCALAAAHAEAGDFANAVLWEKKAKELSSAPGSGGKWNPERLVLYQAGKPFRLSR